RQGAGTFNIMQPGNSVPNFSGNVTGAVAFHTQGSVSLGADPGGVPAVGTNGFNLTADSGGTMTVAGPLLTGSPTSAGNIALSTSSGDLNINDVEVNAATARVNASVAQDANIIGKVVGQSGVSFTTGNNFTLRGSGLRVDAGTQTFQVIP